jgi:hypothetical protein
MSIRARISPYFCAALGISQELRDVHQPWLRGLLCMSFECCCINVLIERAMQEVFQRLNLGVFY